MTSYILPCKNEPFLKNTILDLLKNSTGDYEILVHLDEYYPPKDEIVHDDRVIYIHSGSRTGMRGGIEKCAAIANGDFFVKIDAHCSISAGMNTILREDCPVDGIMIPERRRLDVINWAEQSQDPIKKPNISTEYISYPDTDSDWGGKGINGRQWIEKIHEMKDVLIFDIPGSQGSGWGTSRANYERIGGMHENLWNSFWGESQQLAFSTILRESTAEKQTGTLYNATTNPIQIGTYKVNKKCHYSHWHKGPKKEVEMPDGSSKTIGGRGYTLREQELVDGRNATMRFFKAEKVWEDQVRPLSFIIDLHPGMPGWTDERIDELKSRERLAGWNV